MKYNKVIFLIFCTYVPIICFSCDSDKNNNCEIYRLSGVVCTSPMYENYPIIVATVYNAGTDFYSNNNSDSITNIGGTIDKLESRVIIKPTNSSKPYSIGIPCWKYVGAPAELIIHLFAWVDINSNNKLDWPSEPVHLAYKNIDVNDSCIVQYLHVFHSSTDSLGYKFQCDSNVVYYKNVNYLNFNFYF